GKPLHRNDISRIGYMPEERGLYRKMKVGEQITYFASLKGLSKDQVKEAVRYWFHTFGIEEWWNKKVEELSKGMQQKVQFITTVIHRPEILILDEPFSGFDPVNAEMIKEELLKLKKGGTTIILSTHRMESVEALCDHIALINKSKVVLEGPIKEVRQRFKNNTFELLIQNNSETPPTLETGGFHVLTSEKMAEGHWHLFINAERGIDTNKLLQLAMQHGHIALFREILPDVNEIFIQLVKGQSDE
ncbi:MAG: ATP-binding cassette domain-containing protein, partial [Bacteroidota bacterium]|nr:ATP-binding cassette domain-containing protein [Bacteroidota bacterium]